MIEIHIFEIGDLPTLSDANIDVFHLDLDAGLLSGELEDVYERNRCTRFVTERLRYRYRQSHLAKRTILAAYLRTKANSLQFTRGGYGKPHLKDSPIHFSMSHSYRWGTIAVSMSEIGIDCEQVRDNFDVRVLAPMISHQDEKITGTESFYRTWTRKEAVMKQLGQGLSLEPRRLRVPNGQTINTQWMPTTIEGMTKPPLVTDVPAPLGIFAAASAQQPTSFRVFRLIGRTLDYS